MLNYLCKWYFEHKDLIMLIQMIQGIRRSSGSEVHFWNFSRIMGTDIHIWLNSTKPKFISDVVDMLDSLWLGEMLVNFWEWAGGYSSGMLILLYMYNIRISYQHASCMFVCLFLNQPLRDPIIYHHWVSAYLLIYSQLTFKKKMYSQHRFQSHLLSCPVINLQGASLFR